MSWLDSLKDFCKNINSEIDLKSIQGEDSDSESLVLLATYNEKSKAILSMFDGKGDKTWEKDGIRILKDIAQVILDVTYVTEVRLVDSDFPEKTAEKDIKSILDSLTSLEELSKKLQPEKDIVDCLGDEIVECIRWRKGALLYMFCHTLHHRPPGIQDSQLHYLEEGADYLVSMLKTRSNAKWIDWTSEKELSKDDDTLQLIEQGIFSDTHLLALMYSGEMCYWYSSHPSISLNTPPTKDGTSSPSNPHSKPSAEGAKSAEKRGKTSSSSDKKGCDQKKNLPKVAASSHLQDKAVSKMHCIGNSCLKKYLSVVRGPLAGVGWSTEMAVDIISKFESMEL